MSGISDLYILFFLSNKYLFQAIKVTSCETEDWRRVPAPRHPHPRPGGAGQGGIILESEVLNILRSPHQVK